MRGKEEDGLRLIAQAIASFQNVAEVALDASQLTRAWSILDIYHFAMTSPFLGCSKRTDVQQDIGGGVMMRVTPSCLPVLNHQRGAAAQECRTLYGRMRLGFPTRAVPPCAWDVWCT